jgi:DNA-binding transcriptional ArsR family regulator
MATQTREEPTGAQIVEAVSTLKLLADGTRLRILWALLHGEHSVNELAAHLGAPPAGVSQHLAKLRLGRMVRVRREGTRMFYAADDEHVLYLVEQVLFHADHSASGLRDHQQDPASFGQGAAKEGGRARAR